MGRQRGLSLLSDLIIFVVHHSAAYDQTSTPRSLKRHRKYSNLGYNVIIDDLTDPNDGEFVIVQDAPDKEISNGVYGKNTVAINFCVDGNFETTKFSKDKEDGLVTALARKALLFKWTEKDVRARITTHREVGRQLGYGTACPGKNIIKRMPGIIERVAQIVSGKQSLDFNKLNKVATNPSSVVQELKLYPIGVEYSGEPLLNSYTIDGHTKIDLKELCRVLGIEYEYKKKEHKVVLSKKEKPSPPKKEVKKPVEKKPAAKKSSKKKK